MIMHYKKTERQWWLSAIKLLVNNALYWHIKDTKDALITKLLR